MADGTPPRRPIFLSTDPNAAVAPKRNLTDLAGLVFRRNDQPGRGTHRVAGSVSGIVTARVLADEAVCPPP